MLHLWRAIRTWRERRRLFAEDWKFHRERASAELESLGLSRDDACQTASLRLRHGSRAQARREAEAGWGSLLRTLLPARSLHTAWRIPVLLALAIALLFALNPGRQAAWQTVAGSNFADEVDPADGARACSPRVPSVQFDAPLRGADPCVERAPWVRPDTIPAAFGKASSWIIFVCGLWPLTRLAWQRRESIRLWAYGTVTMSLLAFFAAALFVTAMQYHSLAGYPGWLHTPAFLTYTFAHTLALAWAFRMWRHDLDRRCPNCLELTRLPMERGRLTSPLLDPLEVQSVCILGHGTLTESPYDKRFEDAKSFWDDLAGTGKF